MSVWGMEARPRFICITGLDPRPKAMNTGVKGEFHESKADLEQMRKYREAVKLVACYSGVTWIYADGEPVNPETCYQVMGIKWFSLTGILRTSAPTEIKGKKIEIRLDGLLQAKAEREAKKAEVKPAAAPRAKSPGRPPLTAEQHRATYERRKAMDRERYGYTGPVRVPLTKEQKRAKEAEKKRLQYLRKKLLTGSST